MLPETSSIDIQKDNDHGTSFISHMMFCPNKLNFVKAPVCSCDAPIAGH
jgi:hypothetical protein